MSSGSSEDKRADRTYLREVAYAEPSGLAARSALYEHQHPRIDLVAEVLSYLGPMTGHTVADVGCGNGRYVSTLVAAGAEVIGADLSTGMLAAIPAPTPALVAADAQALPFMDKSFDEVLLMHMLYHVPRPEWAVSEAARILREAGRCSSDARSCVQRARGGLASLTGRRNRSRPGRRPRSEHGGGGRDRRTSR